MRLRPPYFWSVNMADTLRRRPTRPAADRSRQGDSRYEPGASHHHRPSRARRSTRSSRPPAAKGRAFSAWLSRAAEHAAKIEAGPAAADEAMAYVDPPTPDGQAWVDDFMNRVTQPRTRPSSRGVPRECAQARGRRRGTDRRGTEPRRFPASHRSCTPPRAACPRHPHRSWRRPGGMASARPSRPGSSTAARSPYSLTHSPGGGALGTGRHAGTWLTAPSRTSVP